jgi:hypothetical protein
MPFVKRDDNGAIVAVFRHSAQAGLEELDPRDPELSNFLFDTLLDIAARKEWLESDLGLVRVLEDLVQVLIEKGVLMFTDLPEAAQEKLRGRSGFRKQFAYVETLFGSEDAEYNDESGGGGGFL